MQNYHDTICFYILLHAQHQNTDVGVCFSYRLVTVPLFQILESCFSVYFLHKQLLSKAIKSLKLNETLITEQSSYEAKLNGTQVALLT